MKRSVCYLFWLLLPFGVYSNPDSLFEIANQFAMQGAYSPALERYDEITAAYGPSVPVLYNAGIAAQRTGRAGLARLYYERALLHAPHNLDVRQNLEILKSDLEITNQEIRPFFIKRWYRNLLTLFSISTWLWTGGVLLWFGVVLFVYSVFKSDFFGRRFSIPGGVFIMVLGIFCLFLAWQRHSQIYNNHRVVVMKEGTELLFAPDSLATEQISLIPGETGQIEDSLNGYYKLRMYHGEEGWVLEDRVQKISP